METKHTPGPWAWDAGIIPPDGPGRYSDIYVLDEDREPIILAEFNDSLPEGRANARLIAAAPDLLDALKRLMPTNVNLANIHIGDDETIPMDVTLGELRQASAAIAKALGQ